MITNNGTHLTITSAITGMIVFVLSMAAVCGLIILVGG